MAPILSVILALASPFVTQQLPPSSLVSWTPTDCDTIQSEPASYRVPFSIVNSDPQVPIEAFRFVAIAGDSQTPGSCPIIACESPEGWRCHLDPDNSISPGAWSAMTEEDIIAPGQTRSGFAVTVSSPYCCFEVLADGPVFNITAIDTFCVPCDMPVQTSGSTWGRVKGSYR